MKTRIMSLQDALAFQLSGLIHTENKVKKEFEICRHELSSSHLNAELRKYAEQAGYKLLKLERIFNYLMQEPGTRKNEVICKLIEETHQLLSAAGSPHLKDVLMIGCMQNINAYTISTCKSAYLFAVELQLDTAADLLQQILEWELETRRILASLALAEFNRMQQPA